MSVGPARLPVLCVALLPGLAACSLLTIRTPDKPLPQRELNARMLTREFAASFSAKVEVAADGIAATIRRCNSMRCAGSWVHPGRASMRRRKWRP